MKRVGLLTSGGDCQALSAAMRGVVKSLRNSNTEVEIYGFLNGYRGLIYGDFKMLTGKDFAGILTVGGTILGSSRTPFKTIREPDENGLDKVEAMKQNYYKLRLDCLVILGGNGTHKTANLLRQEGLNVITLPKTIGGNDAVWTSDNEAVKMEQRDEDWLASIQFPDSTQEVHLTVKAGGAEKTFTVRVNALDVYTFLDNYALPARQRV